MVAVAGVVPDLDGAGIIWDMLSPSSNLYFYYHHTWSHSFLMAASAACAALVFGGGQRWRLGFWVFLVMHLHFICDLVGSRGGDGYQWPIFYAFPFRDIGVWQWVNQWELNAWPNVIFLCLLLSISVWVARAKKMTFMEVFSVRLNKAAVELSEKF